jgi:phage tail-like protein
MSERVDPVVKFRFSVKIKDAVVGWFTDCSGLTVERETLPQSEGGINDYVHQLPGRVKQSRVTLKRGLADNALWDWFEKGLYDGKVERNNITIILYNSDRTKKKQWDLENAYPVKWTGPDFQSDSNQATIESLEIVHHGLTMRDWAAA